MAKRQITDEEDRLKRQARRRLIGAVALTTAVVVILPMIMDSEPRPAGQNIELKIPDKDNAGAFNPKIDFPPVSAPAAAPPVSSPVVSAVVPAAPPAAPAPVVPPPVEVKPAPTPAAATEAKPAAPSQPAPVPAKAAPVPVKSAPAPAKAPEPEHKATPAKQEPKSAPTKKSAGKSLSEQGTPLPTSGFVLQVGAFNNADTAHSWMSNLKARGFKAYTEKVGDKTRVRIGPYSSHAEADAARRKIEKTQGLHSNIIHLK